MPADHDVVISLPAESARYDRRLRSIGTLDEFELIRHLFVEPSMHPCDEVHGRWRWQPTLDIHPVDFSLDGHMRLRLQGERSSGFLQLRAGECILDIPWPGIVTFDQVR